MNKLFAITASMNIFFQMAQYFSLKKDRTSAQINQLILIDTGNARVELLAGSVGRLVTNSAHDLELYRGGLTSADQRIGLTATTCDLYDNAGNIALQTSQVGGTQAVQLAMSGGKLGFYATAPIALGTVSGARDDPEAALANLLTALSNVGLINDTTTAS